MYFLVPPGLEKYSHPYLQSPNLLWDFCFHPGAAVGRKKAWAALQKVCPLKIIIFQLHF